LPFGSEAKTFRTSVVERTRPQLRRAVVFAMAPKPSTMLDSLEEAFPDAFAPPRRGTRAAMTKVEAEQMRTTAEAASAGRKILNQAIKFARKAI